MAESRKPTFAWDSHNKRWAFWVGDKTQPIVTIDGNGLAVNKGSLSYSSLTVGSLGLFDTLRVGGQGTIQNLNVGTAAIIQALRVAGVSSLASVNLTTGTMTNINVGTAAVLQTVRVAGVASLATVNLTTGTMTNINVGTLAVVQALGVAGVSSLATVNLTTGTMTNINVGTLATVQAANIGGIASLADARFERVKFSTGATLSFVTKLIGTMPLSNVPTAGALTATLTGMTVAVGDNVFCTPKAALIAGVGLGGAWIPTTNLVNVKLINPYPALAGSQPAVGMDVMVFRAAG